MGRGSSPFTTLIRNSMRSSMMTRTSRPPRNPDGEGGLRHLLDELRGLPLAEDAEPAVRSLDNEPPAVKVPQNTNRRATRAMLKKPPQPGTSAGSLDTVTAPSASSSAKARTATSQFRPSMKATCAGVSRMARGFRNGPN